MCVCAGSRARVSGFLVSGACFCQTAAYLVHRPRAGGGLLWNCGHGASALVDLSVSVRERAVFAEGSREHQGQLTYKFAGAVAGTWPWTSDSSVLRPFIGSIDCRCPWALAPRFLASLCTESPGGHLGSSDLVRGGGAGTGIFSFPKNHR